MANDTSTRIWQLDTRGIISKRPVKVQKIVLYPNAAGDTAVIAIVPGWITSAGVSAKSTMELKTVTVSSASVVGSTGNFETAEVADLDIIDIYYTSTGNNIGTYLVLTRDGNDQITTVGATLTNEGPIATGYSWKIYTPLTVTNLLCPATEKMTYEIDFGGGFLFDNFILTGLSTSAKLQVYLV